MKILQKAYKMYTIEGKNISEIAKIVKVDRHALSRNLKKAFNLKVLQDGRKSLNEDYFEEINNPEVAYWLGFMYADGWNREQVHEVGFSQKKKTENEFMLLRQQLVLRIRFNRKMSS